MMRMDDRAIKAAMKKMGIQNQDISATEVIIKTENSDIIITNPHVSKVNMMGQITFQVMGNVTERAKGPEYTDEDVRTVMAQSGSDEKTSRKALDDSKGDLAEAIISLK